MEKRTSVPCYKYADSHSEREVPFSRRRPFCASTRPPDRGPPAVSLRVLHTSCQKMFGLQGEQRSLQRVDSSHPSTLHSRCSIRRALAEAARFSKPRVIGLRGGGLGTGAPEAPGAPGIFLWAEQTSQAPQPTNGLDRKRRNRISTVNRAGFHLSEKYHFGVSRGLRSDHVTGRPLKVEEVYRFNQCALHHVETE